MGHSPQCSGRTPPRTAGWDSQRALLRKSQRTQGSAYEWEAPGPGPFQVAGAEVGESRAELSASVASAGGPGRPWDTRLERCCWRAMDYPGLYTKDSRNQWRVLSNEVVQLGLCLCLFRCLREEEGWVGGGLVSWVKGAEKVWGESNGVERISGIPEVSRGGWQQPFFWPRVKSLDPSWTHDALESAPVVSLGCVCAYVHTCTYRHPHKRTHVSASVQNA